MAPKLILYKFDASPPANALKTLAELIGVELELRDLDFGALEHKSPEYVKLNPMGTVPTLIDGDFAISESHATMKYLLSVYGGDKAESLYPSDVRTRALVDQAMFFNTGVFFIRLKVIVLPALVGDFAGPSEKQKADIEEAYGIVEGFLSHGKKYIAGTDHLTIGDLSVGAMTIASNLFLAIDASKYPRVAAYKARLEEQPLIKKHLVHGCKLLAETTHAAYEKNKKK